MNQPFRVGLTGGIGSGKTTVCNLFEKLGVPIIDADIIAKNIVEPGSEGLKKVISVFGSTLLTDKESLDRKKLRELVFQDKKKLKQLNSILHPLIYQSIEEQAHLVQSSYCIIAIPLLFETNGTEHVDRVVYIDSPIQLQIERTMKRDSVSKTHVENIINSQLPREDKLKLADDIIDNSFSLEYLKNEVNKLHSLYLSLSSTIS